MSFFMAVIIVIFVLIMFNVSGYQNFQIVGVTFAPKHARSKEVKRLQRNFQIEQAVIGGVFILLSFLINAEFFRGWRDFALLVLLFGYLLVTYLSFILYQKRLGDLKHEMNWLYETKRRVADLSVAREKGKVAPSKHWLWPMWLASWLPFFLAVFMRQPWSVLLPLLLIAIILIVIPLSYPFVIRTRTPFVAKESEITQAYMRRYERINGMTYIQSMFLVIVFYLAITLLMLFEPSSFWLLIFLVTFIGLLLVLIISSTRKNRALQDEFFTEKLWHLSESDVQVKWGAYYSPSDPRLFVPKITGTGMTINVAHPAGKVIHAVLGLVLVGVLVMVLVMATANFNVAVDANYVQVSVPMYGIQVDWDDVENIELSQKSLAGTRTNGFGGQEKSFGFFNLEEYGPVRLFVYNEQAAHIDIVLKEGNSPRWIIINQVTTEETVALYNELMSQWESSLNVAFGG